MSNITTIIPTPHVVHRVLLILCASAIYSVNMNSFVHEAALFPGGFAGISLLIQRSLEQFAGAHVPYSVLYLVLNAFPVFISFRFIGKKFTLFSLLMICLSAILTDVVPTIEITSDELLCSIFGGLLSGTAITLCLYADATSGGTDFIAIYFAEKKGVDMWNKVFILNVCVLAVAGFLFGWERALYSIIYQFTSTQVLNMLYRNYQKITLLIITEKPDELYDVVRTTTQHDATKFLGTGCYKNSPKSLLYTVVSADEIHVLTRELKKADPNAFINVLKTKEILGRFFTRSKD